MKTKNIFTLFLVLACLYVYTQEIKIKEKKLDANGVPIFLVFDNESKQYQKGKEEKMWEKYLPITSFDKLKKTKSKIDKLGIEHQTFQQYYKGLKIEHATYLIHLRNGKISSANGDFIKTGDLNIIPKITGEEAIQIALDNIKAKKYAWQSEGWEKMRKKKKGDETATFFPNPELLIWHPYRKSDIYLAYKLTVCSLDPYDHVYIYVDAHTGTILERKSSIRYSTAIGPADTRYSKTKNISTESIASGYKLHDLSRGDGIITYNLENGSESDIINASDFEDDNNTWSAAEWDNINKDNVALDAHWGLQKIYDYFLSEHGRDSWDDEGGVIECYVHYKNNEDNAGWDPSLEVIFLGDGYSVFRPLASLDLMAHEYGHGVTQAGCELVVDGESGCLDEGISDIWAAVIEEYVAPGKQEWKICEEITLQADALRAMDNPNLYKGADTYGDGNDWWADDRPYQCCGVLDFWFYLLSAGDTGTNDNGDNYAVNGIGMHDAAEIVYNVVEYRLTSQSNYSSFRTSSLLAADTLFGPNSNQKIQLTNAWHAVGLGDRFTDYSISGNSTLCTFGYSYSIPYLPSGVTITWDPDPTIIRVSAQGSNPCTFQANGTGDATISATTSIGGSTAVSTNDKTVWLGSPAARIVGLAEVAPYSSATYMAIPYYTCQLSSYSWTISSSLYAFSYFPNTTQSYEIETKGKLGTFYLYLTTTNACGSQNLSKSITVTSGGGGWVPRSVEVPSMIIYPNPAADYINVKVSDGIIAEIAENKSLKYEIILYNSNQQIVYKKKSDDSLISINTKHLDNDFYYLHFIYKNEIIKEQVIISK